MQIAGAGAGAYGMSYVGAVKAFEEKRIVPTKYVGASMGALIGSLWAAGYSSDKIPSIINEMASHYNVFLEAITSVWDIVTMWGIASTLPMQETLKKYLPSKWSDFKFPFYCIATDVNSRGIRIFGAGQREDVPPFAVVVGSATVAPFMSPTKVKIDGKDHYLIDGGFLDSMPVKYLDDEIKVLIAPWHASSLPEQDNIEKATHPYAQINNLVDYFVGIYDTMNRENVLSDLKNIDFLSLATGTKNVANAFDFSKWKENIELGYKDTQMFLTQHPEIR